MKKKGVWSLLQRLHSWCFCRPKYRNPDSGMRKTLPVESGTRKIFLAESEIPGFGIRNTTQGIRIPLTTAMRNPLTKNQESSTWFPESTTWNSESKTVLLIFHWLYFLKRINQLKTPDVPGPQHSGDLTTRWAPGSGEIDISILHCILYYGTVINISRFTFFVKKCLRNLRAVIRHLTSLFENLKWYDFRIRPNPCTKEIKRVRSFKFSGKNKLLTWPIIFIWNTCLWYATRKYTYVQRVMYLRMVIKHTVTI